MEYQNGVRNASDLDQFASVALLDAAMHNTSPVLPGSLSHENRIVSDAEGFSGFSPCDDYTDDPRFLESQREFRDLLLTSAQSLAPTRASSPVEQCGINHHNSKTLFDASVIKQTVSSRRGSTMGTQQSLYETLFSNRHSWTCLLSNSTSRQRCHCLHNHLSPSRTRYLLYQLDK
jgi:hypothetical protein